MAKRKKNESIAEFRKRVSNAEICDTSPPSMDLDVNAPEEGRTIEGLLDLQRDLKRSDNITVSWRLPQDVLDHAKRVSMQESLNNKDEIHYQKLVLSCFLDRFPMSEEDSAS